MHWHSPELASKQKSQMTVLRVAVPTPLLLSLSRIEVMRSVLWSAESGALHSAVHYGPLKTRLYHKSKALWSAESEVNNHGKISNFCTFLIYLDYELLLCSLRSLRSNKPLPPFSLLGKGRDFRQAFVSDDGEGQSM